MKRRIILLLVYLILIPFKITLANEKDEVNNLIKEYYFNFDKASEITNGKKSLVFSLKALEIGEELNRPNFIASACALISSDYEKIGDLKTALHYTLRAAKIYEQLKNITELGVTYNHLGTIYSRQGNYNLAINFFKKAIECHQQGNNHVMVAQDFINLGEVYRESGNHNQALEHFQFAYKTLSKDKDTKSFAYVAGNIGLVYAAQNEIKLASQYLHEATQLLEQHGDYYPITVYQLEAAKTLLKNGKINEALAQADKALALADRENLNEQTKDIYKLLTDIYTKKSDYKNAFYYLSKHNLLKDSLVNHKIIGEMAEMRTEYEVSKKEGEIKSLQEINKLRNRINIILVISVIPIIILTLFLFRFNKKLKNNNAELSSKNQIIKESLFEKETLLKEIHHRVKNNLQIISSLLSLQSNNVKSKKVLAAFHESQQRLHSISLIHQKLYQNENIAVIPMQEYLDDLMQAIHHTFNTKNDVIDYSLETGNIALDIDTAVPLGLIVNELATNAYKYAFKHVKDGRLVISLTKKDEQSYCLTIKDNGPGLPESLNIEEAGSLGLRLVNILTRQLRGQLETKSTDGAEFNLIFTEIIQHKS